MNKEIKDIAKIVIKELDRSTDGTFYTDDIATALYEAGYRKQSDTIKEFAEILKSYINNKKYKAGFTANMLWADSACELVDKLAKEYGVE